MAFENLTFQDANVMCKKTYEIRNEFYYDTNEFPAIITTQSDNNTKLITSVERGTEYINGSGAKRSY